jgi:hypothetical protein
MYLNNAPLCAAPSIEPVGKLYEKKMMALESENRHSCQLFFVLSGTEWRGAEYTVYQLTVQNSRTEEAYVWKERCFLLSGT